MLGGVMTGVNNYPLSIASPLTGEVLLVDSYHRVPLGIPLTIPLRLLVLSLSCSEITMSCM